MWHGNVLQHLAHEGEGFAHVHAVVGARILQGFVVLQFRFRIAQRGQRMAGACRSRAERNDRCNELVVCRTQPVAAFGVVYQVEELRFCQYEMFHLLSVLCCYTWVEVCAHKTIGQTAVQRMGFFAVCFASR